MTIAKTQYQVVQILESGCLAYTASNTTARNGGKAWNRYPKGEGTSHRDEIARARMLAPAAAAICAWGDLIC